MVHWQLMGGLLHLVQRGGDWVGWGPTQSPPHCMKCNSPHQRPVYQLHIIRCGTTGFEYILTVINTVYFSTWLHKHKVRLTKFWNSDRNHGPNALRKCFLFFSIRSAISADLRENGSALEVVVHDYALYKSTFTLLYFTLFARQTLTLWPDMLNFLWTNHMH